MDISCEITAVQYVPCHGCHGQRKRLGNNVSQICRNYQLDKAAEDATTVEEVIKVYGSQPKRVAEYRSLISFGFDAVSKIPPKLSERRKEFSNVNCNSSFSFVTCYFKINRVPLIFSLAKHCRTIPYRNFSSLILLHFFKVWIVLS